MSTEKTTANTTTTKLIAFHNDPALANTIRQQVQAHYDADEIIKGRYWEHGKGCAVGCIIHSESHAKFETALGIPKGIAHLLDGLFEALPNGHSKELPRRFVNAIKPGADLGMVIPQFLYWMLAQDDEAVQKSDMYADTKRFVDAVAALFEEWTRTGIKPGPDSQAARAPWAAWAAWDARAARAPWAAWDARAARAAWDAAAWDAWDARAAWATWATWDAWDARDARDAWDARRDARNTRAANKLIELLESAPVVQAAEVPNAAR